MDLGGTVQPLTVQQHGVLANLPPLAHNKTSMKHDGLMTALEEPNMVSKEAASSVLPGPAKRLRGGGGDWGPSSSSHIKHGTGSGRRGGFLHKALGTQS